MSVIYTEYHLVVIGIIWSQEKVLEVDTTLIKIKRLLMTTIYDSRIARVSTRGTCQYFLEIYGIKTINFFFLLKVKVSC